MQELTLGEKIRLGVLNGRVMGLSLKDYNTIAVLSQLDPQCVAAASSLMTSFEEITGGLARYYPLSSETLKEAVEGVTSFNPQAIVLLVGGGEKLEECQRLLKTFLEALADKSFKADIVISLRGYLAGCSREIAKDVTILSYVELLRYLKQWGILTHEVDFERETMKFGRLSIEGEKVSFETIAEYPLTAEHSRLLRKLVS